MGWRDFKPITSIDKIDNIDNMRRDTAEKGHFVDNVYRDMTVTERPLPYFGTDGDIVIPFGCDRRYHWWAGGQSTAAIIEELKSWVH